MVKVFQCCAKVAKFRQIWSHWWREKMNLDSEMRESESDDWKVK